MRRSGFTTLAALALALTALGAAPPVPPTPAPVAAVVLARAFVVETPFEYEWSAEHPAVTAGTILVIEANPELLRTREVAEPVLFVGRWPAQRLGRASGGGRAVVFVPARVDLASEPVFFGTPGLPEQVSALAGENERRAARAAGIAPLSRAMISAATARGGPESRFASKVELLLATQELAREYAPE